MLRSAQVAFSKPGLCSDPAHPQPSLAQNISPRPGMLCQWGQGAHRTVQALCLKCFSYGKPRSCLCFWQLPCPLALAMQSLLLAPCPAIPEPSSCSLTG